MIRGGDRGAAWDPDGNLLFSQLSPEKTERMRPRPKPTVEDPERLLVDVSLGRPKPEGLNDAESEFWDDLAVEVDAIHAAGQGVEIPGEIPDISDDDAE